MSHHNDSPDVVPQTDITDIYVFQKPGDPSKTILIMNVNPYAPTRASQFNPDASYEWKIDTNADFEAEIAFHIIFRSSGAVISRRRLYTRLPMLPRRVQALAVK